MIKIKTSIYRSFALLATCVCAAIAIAMLLCSCGFVHDSAQKQKNFMVYGIDRATYNNPTAYRALAFDTKRETIYAINDISQPNRIDVLDYEGNFKNTPITGFHGRWNSNNNNTDDVIFSKVSDIKIHNDMLFVSSMTGCRVDVYRLPARNSSFIMSLGRGGGDKSRLDNGRPNPYGDAWNGNQNNGNGGLFHPKALAVTDNFIFVTEYRDTIAVYTTDVLTASNHLKAQKFCDLSWSAGKNARNRQWYIEYLNVIDGKLYATSDGLTDVYVYDINKLARGVTAQPDTTYKKSTGALQIHGMTQSDDIIFVSHGSGSGNANIKAYDVEEFTNSLLKGRDLPPPFVSFSNVFGQSMNVPKNIYFEKNNLYFNNVSYKSDNHNVTPDSISGKIFKVKWSAYEIKEK